MAVARVEMGLESTVFFMHRPASSAGSLTAGLHYIYRPG